MALVFLGDLTVERMVKRLGIEIDQETQDTLSSMISHDAQHIPEDKIHIFDIPFGIACGGLKAQQKIVELLSKYKDQKTNEMLQCWNFAGR